MITSKSRIIVLVGLVIIVIGFLLFQFHFFGNKNSSRPAVNFVPKELGLTESISSEIVALGENSFGIKVKPFLIEITPATVFVKGGQNKAGFSDLKLGQKVTVEYIKLTHGVGVTATRIEIAN